MSTINLIIWEENRLDFRLRTICGDDIENLRLWKNQNKASFFLKEDITPDQQKHWYQGIRNREQDFMFIVEQKDGGEWQEVGCMGIRKLADEGCIDAYNIIRSRRIEPASFKMSDAFRVMLSFSVNQYSEFPVRCKVLCNNPAVEWYKNNNFSVVGSNGDYILLELDKETLKDLRITIKNK